MYEMGWEELNPVVNYVNYLRCAPSFQFGPRVISTHQFIFVARGLGTAHIQDRSYLAREGDLFYYGPNITHFFEADSERPFELYGVHFGINESLAFADTPITSVYTSKEDMAMQARNGLIMGKGTPYSLYVEDHVRMPLKETEDLMLQLVASYAQGTIISALANRTLMIKLFLLLKDRVREGQAASPAHLGLMRQIMQKLEERSEAPYERQWLKEWTGYHEDYVARLFQELCGMSPHQKHQMMKLDRAKELLRGSSLTVTEIAERLAFASVHYFCKVFKGKTGYTPMQYRTLCRMI